MALPFGESHWDYLPDLIQNYIEDLAAIAIHRERMKTVCKSIHLYGEWCYQNQSIMEMFLDYYPEIYRFHPSVIESQICPECFKIFSHEIVLSKHLSICRGLDEMSEEESFFEDDYDDDYIDEPIDFLKNIYIMFLKVSIHFNLYLEH